MGNDVLKIPRQVPVPLPLKYFNYGIGASSSTFWRGDGTWAAANSGTILSATISGADLSTLYTHIASLPLTTGSWCITAQLFVNGATSAAYMNGAITSTIDSVSGTVDGVTHLSTPISSVPAGLLVFSGVDITVGSNTTYYFNVNGNGTGTGILYGYFRAVRTS